MGRAPRHLLPAGEVCRFLAELRQKPPPARRDTASASGGHPRQIGPDEWAASESVQATRLQRSSSPTVEQPILATTSLWPPNPFGVRKLERLNAVLLLGGKAKRSPACDEQLHGRGRGEEYGKGGRCREELLELVEQEQQPALAQVLGNPSPRAQLVLAEARMSRAWRRSVRPESPPNVCDANESLRA
jgi:hypothetical protein